VPDKLQWAADWLAPAPQPNNIIPLSEQFMRRVTIMLDDALMDEIDRFIVERGYQNRSEAVRDLARAGVRQAMEDSGMDGACVAALVYVYEPDVRDLPKRLTDLFHDHHDLSVSAMHVHLDRGACLEVNVLRGDGRDLRCLGDSIIAERGVRHGRLVMVPAESDDICDADCRDRHDHAHARKAD
jgi:CopG family nickel-responsive transcriptional regulator